MQLYGTMPMFVVLHAHLQGLLSEAVQWPVLHEQLMSSRQSHGKLWQLLTTHVRVGMIVCTCLVCVCVRTCVSSSISLSRFLPFVRETDVPVQKSKKESGLEQKHREGPPTGANSSPPTAAPLT